MYNLVSSLPRIKAVSMNIQRRLMFSLFFLVGLSVCSTQSLGQDKAATEKYKLAIELLPDTVAGLVRIPNLLRLRKHGKTLRLESCLKMKRCNPSSKHSDNVPRIILKRLTTRSVFVQRTSTTSPQANLLSCCHFRMISDDHSRYVSSRTCEESKGG